jgi:hypothetical protein
MKTPVAIDEEFAFTPSGPEPRRRAPSVPKLSLPRREGPSRLSGIGGLRENPRLVPLALVLLVLVIAAAVVLLRSGGSGDGSSGDTAAPLTDTTPVVFKYALAAGQTRTYDMTIDMNFVPRAEGAAQPFSGKVAATMSFNVVKQLPNGAIVLDVAITNVKIDPAPQGTPPTDGSRMRVTLAPDGRVLYFEGDGNLFGASGGGTGSLFAGSSQATGKAESQFLFPQFPTEAVKQGDEWTESSSFPLPFGGDEITINTKGVHRGFEDSSYGRAAKIQYTIQSPFDIAMRLADLAKVAAEQTGGEQIAVPPEVANAVFKLTGNMTMDAENLVLPETGDLVKLVGTMKASMALAIEGLPSSQAGGAPSSMEFDTTMTMSITRTDGATAS